MIFHALMAMYPRVDRANIVLTTMIVYLLTYIALPDDWNFITVSGLIVLDLFLSKLNVLQGPGLRLKRKLDMIMRGGFSSFGLARSKETSAPAKRRRVRFGKNQYRYYDPWSGRDTQGVRQPHYASTANYGDLSGMTPAGPWQRPVGPASPTYPHYFPTTGGAIGAGGRITTPLNLDLTPRERLSQGLGGQGQPGHQGTQGTQGMQGMSHIMIDNRHLVATNDDDESGAESDYSDDSSDLSNHSDDDY